MYQSPGCGEGTFTVSRFPNWKDAKVESQKQRAPMNSSNTWQTGGTERATVISTSPEPPETVDLEAGCSLRDYQFVECLAAALAVQPGQSAVGGKDSRLWQRGSDLDVLEWSKGE